MNKPKYLIIHHSAISRNIQKIQLPIIERYHKKEFGMKSELGFWTGYNYLIESNGCLIQTRKDGEETAAVIGHNKDSLHICLAGNFDIEFPTQPQINKLKSWLIEKMRIWGLETSAVYEHRDMQKYRTCPGAFIPKKYGQLLVSPIAAQPMDAKKQKDLLNFIKK